MHVGRVLRKIAWIAGITILVCVVLILIALAPTEDLPSFIRHKTRALTTRRFDSTPERLKRGPLQGLEGILIREKNSCWVVVSIELLSQSVATEVTIGDVEVIYSRTQAACNMLQTV